MASKKQRSWLYREAGNQLVAIERSSIHPVETPVSSDVATELLCSYNWTTDPEPTIVVPGGAPSWTGGDLPKTVLPDSGRQFIDQDGAKVPKHPFESVFRAIEVQRPGYRFDSVDCLVNRNSLRKLLDFCKGTKIRSDFRMNVYAVHNTLIIERCEKRTVDLLHGSANSGHGHNFERAFTKYAKGLGNSTSHHRVLQYKFADLEMAVRFEVDASHTSNTDGDAVATVPAADLPHSGSEQLSKELSSLNLATTKHETKSPKASSIIVHRKGKGTLQSTTAEIKTAQKSVQLWRVLPQMWFGRTPLLIRGLHTDGEFHKINIEPVDLDKWENDARNQLALRKMASLIERLRDVVMNTSNRAAIVVLHQRDADRLKILERKADKLPLPKDVIEKFWAGE